MCFFENYLVQNRHMLSKSNQNETCGHFFLHVFFFDKKKVTAVCSRATCDFCCFWASNFTLAGAACDTRTDRRMLEKR